jgi:Ca2+/Na+ antiporter
VLPDGRWARAAHVAIFPAKAALHLTIPSVHYKRWVSYYPLTMLVAFAWLLTITYAMTIALDAIGCALALPSTVVGLTIGAIGTGLPSLFAAVYTARAGQGGAAICQVLGTNTFNVCIGLGLVWFFEAAVGSCSFGSLGKPVERSCGGCYHPTGFAAMCPFLVDEPPPPESTALVGTAFISVFLTALVLLTAILSRCRVPRTGAAVLLVVYALYLVYEILASAGFIAPLCPRGLTSYCL